LVVDDDADVRTALIEVLEDEGYKVQSARNGAEALQLVNGPDRPSVVILDLMMPVMDGHEFLERVKSTPAAVIPVVVVSASSTRRTPSELPFLRKPVQLEALLGVIQKFCQPLRAR
jgi:CheY-like chemotaxis protein